MFTPNTERFRKSLTIKVTATALALSAALNGAGAVADQRGYQQKQDGQQKQHGHRHTVSPASHRDEIRLNLPVRDHGAENLALRRMVNSHSNLNLDHYRLKAVVTENGRYSNGYASLRTGKHKTGRYLLSSRQKTRIPAPSDAHKDWRLRLGPGTNVRSVTLVLEPRRTQAELDRTREKLSRIKSKNKQPQKQAGQQAKEPNHRYVISGSRTSTRTRQS